MQERPKLKIYVTSNKYKTRSNQTFQTRSNKLFDSISKIK